MTAIYDFLIILIEQQRRSGGNKSAVDLLNRARKTEDRIRQAVVAATEQGGVADVTEEGDRRRAAAYAEHSCRLIDEALVRVSRLPAAPKQTRELGDFRAANFFFALTSLRPGWRGKLSQAPFWQSTSHFAEQLIAGYRKGRIDLHQLSDLLAFVLKVEVDTIGRALLRERRRGRRRRRGEEAAARRRRGRRPRTLRRWCSGRLRPHRRRCRGRLSLRRSGTGPRGSGNTPQPCSNARTSTTRKLAASQLIRGYQAALVNQHQAAAARAAAVNHVAPRVLEPAAAPPPLPLHVIAEVFRNGSDELKRRLEEVVRRDDLDEPGKAAVLSQLIRADVAEDAARQGAVGAVLNRVINKVVASSDEGLAEVANRALISCSEYVVRCGGAADALAGWHPCAELRKAGNSAGTYDVYFHSPDGKRYRSRNEVVRALGLEPTEYTGSKRSGDGQLAASPAARLSPAPVPMTAAEAHAAAAAEGLTLLRSESWTGFKNATGFKGVCRTQFVSKPFKANLWHAGSDMHLGTFVTAEEAALAVARARRALELQAAPPAAAPSWQRVANVDDDDDGGDGGAPPRAPSCRTPRRRCRLSLPRRRRRLPTTATHRRASGRGSATPTGARRWRWRSRRRRRRPWKRWLWSCRRRRRMRRRRTRTTSSLACV